MGRKSPDTQAAIQWYDVRYLEVDVKQPRMTFEFCISIHFKLLLAIPTDLMLLEQLARSVPLGLHLQLVVAEWSFWIQAVFDTFFALLPDWVRP